jgi:hypothetical protein
MLSHQQKIVEIRKKFLQLKEGRLLLRLLHEMELEELGEEGSSLLNDLRTEMRNEEAEGVEGIAFLEQFRLSSPLSSLSFLLAPLL